MRVVERSAPIIVPSQLGQSSERADGSLFAATAITALVVSELYSHLERSHLLVVVALTAFRALPAADRLRRRDWTIVSSRRNASISSGQGAG